MSKIQFNFICYKVHFNKIYLLHFNSSHKVQIQNVQTQKKTHRQYIILLSQEKLTKLMRNKNQKYMKQLFAKFIQSRSEQVAELLPQQQIEEIIEQISESEEIIQEQEQEVQQDLTLSDYISTLSVQEKRRFKQQNPELPETFFMSKVQKEKFFIRKGSKFQNDLKHTPTRKSKNHNRVHFKNEFNYKPFNQHQKPVEVKKAKEFNQNYDNKIHFS